MADDFRGNDYRPNGPEAEPEPDAKAEIARLARLSAIDYERERIEAARRLGFRASVLDAEVEKARPEAPDAEAEDAVEVLEPWPDPVDGAAVAEEIRERLKAHVVFSNATDVDALTLWILGTYCMPAWRLFPKVLIWSPTKRCGKTMLMETVEAFANRAMMCSNISAAALFRSIEKWSPTLLIDEADRFLRDKEELNGIINAGHTRRSAYVNRCVEVNGEQDVRRFSVWCPQVFAGIGSQADTLVDRSIMIGLRRKLPTDTVERLPFDLHERMVGIRRKIARWAGENSIRIASMDDEPSPCGNDRLRDNYTPLWRLAAALGGVWPQRIAAAYDTRARDGDDADEPAGIMLLRDLAGIFDERKAQRLPSSSLVADLIAMEDRPWTEWKQGRPLTAQSIARLLRPFDVRPRNAKQGSDVLKMYFATDVSAAYVRYAANAPSDPLPRYRAESKEKNDTSTRYQSSDGSGSKGEINSEKQYGSGVAGKSPLPGGHPCTDEQIDRAVNGANGPFQDDRADICAHCGEPGADSEGTDGTLHARLHRGCIDAWFAATADLKDQDAPRPEAWR